MGISMAVIVITTERSATPFFRIFGRDAPHKSGKQDCQLGMLLQESIMATNYS